MTKLDVAMVSDEINFISKIKKSLIKNFNSSKEKDITKSIQLANYLVSLENLSEAERLLLSAVRLEYIEEEGHLWSSNAQGIILLAWIARLSGHTNKEKEYIAVINEYDICSTHYPDRYEWYKDCLEDHPGNMEYGMGESQKYKCEVVCQEILTFLYFYEMLPFYKNVAPKTLKKDLNDIIEKCYAVLRDALINK